MHPEVIRATVLEVRPYSGWFEPEVIASAQATYAM